MQRLAHLLLVTASPFQRFIDKPPLTHSFCNARAIDILAREAFLPCADFFSAYIKEINQGGFWADSQWKNIDHYLEPKTGRGIWPFGNALDTFQQYFARAVKDSRQGNRCKAAFFLGAASHLVQDMCVPHHARGRMFSGHQDYEIWAMKHYSEFAVEEGGVYRQGNNTADFIMKNACVTAELLDAVDADKGNAKYDLVTRVALPLAQRSTAGLFENFHRLALNPLTIINIPLATGATIVA